MRLVDLDVISSFDVFFVICGSNFRLFASRLFLLQFFTLSSVYLSKGKPKMLPGDNNLTEPLELPEVVQQRLLEEIMLAEQQEILNAEEQELPPAIAAAAGGLPNNQAPARPQRRGPGGLIVRGGPRTRRSRGRRRGRRSTDDAPAYPE